MSFAVEDFHQLLALLEQHPEWRAELRRVVLSEEMLHLPDLVRELAEAQKQTDKRLDRTAAILEQLTQRVDTLAEKVNQLTIRLDELTERVNQLTIRLDELTERVDQLTQRVDALVTWANRITDDIGKLKQWALEHLYASRAPAFFGKLVRRTHALSAEELDHLLEEALESGKITPQERDDLLDTDLVVRGRWHEDGEPVYLVVEISWGIGLDDTRRALRRAQTIAKIGTRTVPVVAGERATEDAIAEAHEFGVWQVLDARIEPPRKHKSPISPEGA
ncbi:MAG: hypothetical protein HPY54_09030 [Chthonomonadetes bacterium]|nr:hypothetical protein [Chthonomonadetes bacterium]